MDDIFKDILNDPKIFNKDGKIQSCIFKKYPEVVKYCEEMLKLHPEYEKPIMYFAFVSRGINLNKCVICGKTLTYTKHINNISCCCKKCADTYRHEQVKKSMLKKYGVECSWSNKEVREKCQNTMIEKYGSHSSLSPDVKEKMKRTVMEKYGVSCSLHNKEIADKARKTIKEKYGLECSPNSLGGKINGIRHTAEKHREKFEEFDKVLKQNNIIQLGEYIGKNDGTTFRRYMFKCGECDNIFEDYYFPPNHYPICKICNPKNWQSCQYENKLHKFLNNLNIEFTTNTRSVISPYELDVFIPDKNIAIEIDGLYWHSDAKIKDKNYHLMKQNMCQSIDVRLIHIFEDEIRDKWQIVKSRIKAALGLTPYKIQARKCTVKEIDSKLANKFIEKYHIQGSAKSSVNMGLFYKNRLCAVMTFCKSRFNKKYEWELLRYCTLSNFNVIGGAGKLLRYFRNEYKSSVISYADKRWSDGKLYKQLGFNELTDSPPAYWYVKNQNRYNRVLFQKHKLKNKLELFDPNLSEIENMKNNKFKLIWDCGNKVFVLSDKE